MMLYLGIFGFAVFFGLVIAFVGTSVIERGFLSAAVLCFLLAGGIPLRKRDPLAERWGTH